jgi:glycosyltransferase involved in cell wall biosynthesis
MSAARRPIRVLRVISRLNIGGPAIHVALLSRPSSSDRIESLLVTGLENPGEGTMIEFVRSQGVEPVIIPELVADSLIGPRDLVALWRLVRLIRQFRPDIVDTHTAKAGFIGRIAGALTGVPVRIHTFHGHVLQGYYSATKNTVFRRVEKALARLSTRLIAVSDRVKLDLIEYGVARPEKIEVIPLGLDLSPFLNSSTLRGSFKRELGLPESALLVGIVSRIFAIKNHALFVDAAARVTKELPDARFVVVGDGALRADMEERARHLGLDGRVIFTGWRRDLPAIYADLAALVISSNNEGTPFSAIEAMAAAVPVVGTRVGGMPDLIREGTTGILVPPRDADAMSAALVSLLKNSDRRRRMGDAARADVETRFDVARMLTETHALYEACLRKTG